MRHCRKHIIIAYIFCGIIPISQSCNRPTTPVVTTANITGITETTALSGGNVTDNGGAEVTARGVCWSTSQNPATTASKTIDGSGNGSFASSITGLTQNTTYYVRAYASNSEGTSYGNEVSFATKSNSVQDIDGNTYNIVQIGSQVWMKENLKTTRYKDGSAIPLVSDNTSWSNLSSPGYCWYNNDAPSYGSTYGAIYNWYAVNTGKLCPTGWHVPADTEWTLLVNYLGGFSIAGGKMKEQGTAHWLSPNTGATNSSGFTGLPGGYRRADGVFARLGDVADLWSSTQIDAANAWDYGFDSIYEKINRDNDPKTGGFSVRCLKD